MDDAGARVHRPTTEGVKVVWSSVVSQPGEVEVGVDDVVRIRYLVIAPDHTGGTQLEGVRVAGTRMTTFPVHIPLAGPTDIVLLAVIPDHCCAVWDGVGHGVVAGHDDLHIALPRTPGGANTE